MNIINLFGEPSAGKSTTMAGLYSYLSKKGYNVEIAREEAKKYVYEENLSILNQQIFLLGEQNRVLQSLKQKVDIVITDCPLLMGNIYIDEIYKDGECKKLRKYYKLLALELFNSYNNINFFLKRNHDYVCSGRIHDEDKSLELSINLKKYLKKNKINYKEIETCFNIEKKIYKLIKDKI